MTVAEEKRRKNNSKYSEQQIFDNRYFGSRLRAYRERAKARSIEFNLDSRYIKELWGFQKRHMRFYWN